MHSLQRKAPAAQRGWPLGRLSRDVVDGQRNVLKRGTIVLFSRAKGHAVRIWEPTVGQLILPSGWVSALDEDVLQ
jgi:hypothetical protein